jgi:hypothetical protein
VREWQSAVYWALAGVLIGFGGLALFSVGLPFLFAGAVMAVVAVFRLWIEGAWAATLGIGGAPMAALAGLFGQGAAAPPFSADEVVVLTFFGAIALSGPAFRLLAGLRRRRR